MTPQRDGPIAGPVPEFLHQGRRVVHQTRVFSDILGLAEAGLGRGDPEAHWTAATDLCQDHPRRRETGRTQSQPTVSGSSASTTRPSQTKGDRENPEPTN